jgi:hypothetical protein
MGRLDLHIMTSFHGHFESLWFTLNYQSIIIALITQRIITSSVFKLGTSFLALYSIYVNGECRLLGCGAV